MNELILALDPGRDKTGVAVVDEELKVHTREIVFTENLNSYLSDLFHRYNVNRIILGDGTTSGEMKERLAAICKKPIPIQLVEESYTTREAEKRYQNDKLGRGLNKLLGFVNWKPDVPVDDYVAVILAERYFEDDD